MLRIREDFRTSSSLQTIGQSWAQNHAPNAKPPKPSSYSEFPSNRQETFGEGIRRVSIDENHGRPPYRDGGPFLAYQARIPKYKAGDVHVYGRRKTASFGSIVILPNDGSDWRLHYMGGFTKSLSSVPTAYQNLGGAENLSQSNGVLGSSPYVNPDDLEDLGNRAYNALRPKVEKVNLLQAVAEAKDLPKMLKTTGKGFHGLWQSLGGNGSGWKAAPKGAADQFLNAAFGWSPFVSDIVGTCDTILFAADHIAQIQRNNNRWLQRRFREEVIESDDVVYGSYGNTTNMCDPVLGADYIVPYSGSFEIRRQRMTAIWYEGSFKYYRPEFDAGLKSGYPSVQKLRQMATLLGLNINATTLYRVMPWTWLVDWFAGVSGNIQLLEDMATGQVASRYLYLMRHTFDRFEYKVKFETYDGQVTEVAWYKSSEVKRRVEAQSPFGFSKPPSGLSGMQYGILAALGISYVG